MTEDTAAIEVAGLRKTFGDVHAIEALDLEVPAGQVHGLVGPNGAGKTTLLRILFGLVTPDDGTVTILGTDRASVGGPFAEVGGFVEEPRFYPYLSGHRNLELVARLGGDDEDQIADVLETVGLADRAKRKVGGYSSGMRQRLGLAASLLRRPRVLLLDEPTIGLDPVGSREMLDTVRSLAAGGVTVLISSHNMSELEDVCDAISVMREGRDVWHGSMEDLRAAAPAPAHRLETSDDPRTIGLAEQAGLTILHDPDGWLTVSADRAALDAFVISLGKAGVAVRRLELFMTALESMFFELTGARAERSASGERSDEPSDEVEATR